MEVIKVINNALNMEWKEKVDEFKLSGKSQIEWCKERNIHPRRFSYWFLKFKNDIDEKDPAINWIPVSIDNHIDKNNNKITSSTTNKSITIRIGKAVVEIEKGFDASLLAEAVKVLGAIC
jgi:hypothetical protein